MAWLEKYQSLYMDVLVSASLFALLHIADKGLVISDFIHHFVLGFIFSPFYRKNKTHLLSDCLAFSTEFA